MTLPIRRRKDWVCAVTKLTCRAYLSVFFSMETRGESNLPQRDGFILLSKHQCWEDIPILALATPRALSFVAKYELFTNPLGGWLISSMGGIPLNRARPMESRQSLRVMMELVRNGQGVAIFPEGTYYPNRMGPGHSGLVRMLGSRFRIPFIPVGISYRQEKWRTRVLVHFGKPLYKDPAMGPQAFLEEFMLHIGRLSGLAEGAGRKGDTGDVRT